jgi:predicted Rossmann fold nucleotide-binding protein DprA/Smf involved in DNA uptake
MLSNDAKAVLALTTRLGDRQRPSLTAQGWHDLATALRDSELTPADVFTVDLSEVPGVGADTAGQVGRLLEDAAAATLAADDLRLKGIWVSTIVDDEYPAVLVTRLGRNAPPVIFGIGNQTMLSTPGVGIVGSRDIGEDGAEVARVFAERAVSLGLPVVSGGARGVDHLAMNAAFMASGQVIGVLADSLLTRMRKPEILEALDEGKTCLLTQQAPSSGFTPAAAMSRNKLIYALSDVTVVVASDKESGGTWAGAIEALRAGNGVVAVWRGEGEGPGNADLERRGASPVKTPDDLDRLLQAPPPPPSEQLSLIDPTT